MNRLQAIISRPRKLNQRRAMTLIELLVVIAVGSLLTGLAVLMLFLLAKSHSAGREHLLYRGTVNALAKQFRDDVHASKKTSTEKDTATFQPSPESSQATTFRYQCLPGRIDRTELQGEKIIRQESYMLPTQMEAAIDIQTIDDAVMASIIITPEKKADSTASISKMPKLQYTAPVRIEAVLDSVSQLAKVTAIKKKADTEKESTEKPATDKPALEKPVAEEPAKAEQPAEKSSTDMPAAEEKP